MTIRVRVQEELADPTPSPVNYYGAACRVWLAGGLDFYEDEGKTDPCEDGDTIEKWGDQSANGYDGDNNGTDPIYDEDAANNLGGAVFVRVNADELQINKAAIQAADTEIWFFMTVKCTETGANSAILGYNETGVGTFFFREAAGDRYVTHVYAPGNLELETFCTYSNWNVFVVRIKEDDKVETWINGVWKSQTAIGVFGVAAWDKEFVLGRKVTVGDHAYMNGTWADMFVVVGALTAAQREWGEDYLMARYNIS